MLEIEPGADVEVRMDSKLVVEQMAGRWKIKHADMRRLAIEARELATRIEQAGGSVDYAWIPRADNAVADALSNDGMDGETVRRDHWRTSGSVGAQADSSDSPPAEPAVVEVAEQVVLSTDESPASPPDAGKPARILLVRHGVTAFTEQGASTAAAAPTRASASAGSRRRSGRRRAWPSGSRASTGCTS
ncbi:hypothetical protein GCM10025872_20620 [Barrientosiimonas endolithica]|uniref:RNase H type-1 domain-containing protein n=1 Tax=Barrientosiimonas endolithica TaxID=1535208 RepID=A0ABM8HC37_9MICO|nr:hypothetical protein GCM10025872_20620 [Barrientosiimonas endolithica]